MERRTNIGSLTAAAVLVSLSWMVKASPLPGNIHAHPLGHSLASFATTNSFLYTNKIGSFNYRFTKPTLSFSKLIGFPQHQSVSLLNTERISPTFTSGTNEAVPLGKNVVIGGAQVSSDYDSVSDFPPPSAMSNPPVPAFSLDLHPGDITEENSNKDDVKESKGFLSQDEDHKLVLPENKTVETVNSGSSKPSHDEEKPIESSSEIERLVNKVINAPIRRIGMPVSKNDELAGNVRQNAGSSLETLPQSRQDSSLEQPIPFFSPENSHKPSSQEVFHEPRPNSQFSLPGSGGNYRFSPASSLPQPQHSNLFSGFNRFSVPQNSLLQNSQSQPSLPQPLSNSNGLSEPATSQNHEPLNFPNSPFQSQPPFPSYNPGLGANPPPGPEPENGFNPFFLSENYPEPPYESEFVNDHPLADYEESSEHSGRSAGRNNNGHHVPLNFAQGTLRNIRTEELLEVVRRKQIPPECVYNTISYGANGEDCIEARKKRQVQVVQ